MPEKDFLLVVCNYASYKNSHKIFLPNLFAREKAGDMAGANALNVCACSPKNIVNVSAMVAICNTNAKTQVCIHNCRQ